MQIEMTRDLAHMLSEALSQYIENTVGDEHADPLTADQTHNVLLAGALMEQADTLIAGAAR